jgi:hypothetical protein
MFGKKYIEHAESAEAKLLYANMRLKQFEDLVEKLKGFDWFEMNSAGGIIAHEKDEPTSDCAIYGTCLTVPYEYITLT